MEPVAIIGDVHGCIDELEHLLDQLDGRPVVFVGDLINKGPDSLAVLERVLSLQARAVIGNHELGFLSYLKSKRHHVDFEEVERQLGIHCANWARWIQALPTFIETPDWLVVHAGLVPGQHPAESDPRVLTRIRTWDGTGKRLNNPADPPWFDLYDGQKLVVFGHWAVRGLVMEDRVIGLDTGCVYGGQLTAVLLPERRLVQVAAKRAYCPISS
ncbi:MAG: metallophosphoesterase [Acidobacteria bacterium]|nr:metallophosphoesterase [Acidobacteriota bacterium]